VSVFRNFSEKVYETVTYGAVMLYSLTAIYLHFEVIAASIFGDEDKGNRIL
jgi:hypothetical protein